MWKEVNGYSFHDFSAKHTPSATFTYELNCGCQRDLKKTPRELLKNKMFIDVDLSATDMNLWDCYLPVTFIVLVNVLFYCKGIHRIITF